MTRSTVTRLSLLAGVWMLMGSECGALTDLNPACDTATGTCPTDDTAPATCTPYTGPIVIDDLDVVCDSDTGPVNFTVDTTGVPFDGLLNAMDNGNANHFHQEFDLAVTASDVDCFEDAQLTNTVTTNLALADVDQPDETIFQCTPEVHFVDTDGNDPMTYAIRVYDDMNTLEDCVILRDPDDGQGREDAYFTGDWGAGAPASNAAEFSAANCDVGGFTAGAHY